MLAFLLLCPIKNKLKRRAAPGCLNHSHASVCMSPNCAKQSRGKDAVPGPYPFFQMLCVHDCCRHATARPKFCELGEQKLLNLAFCIQVFCTLWKEGDKGLVPFSRATVATHCPSLNCVRLAAAFGE
eukprot:5924152-Amphidinium_carterae.1